MKNNKTQSIITISLTVGILLIINVLSNFINLQIDLTEEKRFSLTEATKRQVKNLDDVVFVRVLLEGSFPAGFKRLQTSVRDLLNDFKSINPSVDFAFEDPNVSGTPAERKARMDQLAAEGLVPMRLRVVDKEKTEQYIYPYAEVNYRNRKVIVRLLENDVPGQNPEVTLNNSVSLLEYKFANALQKIRSASRPRIAFTTGHGELKPDETADLEQTLKAYYETSRINLDSIGVILFSDSARRIDLLVVAKPLTAFSESAKFRLDQYIMQGGKVVWLIDRLNADLAGMQQTGEMLPTDYPLNLEDMLFKYGVRINPNLVVDMECSRIPLKVGAVGGAPQMELFQWYYFPIVSPSTAHPIVKNLDRVWLQFPSSLDTIRTKSAVKKTVLLTSSKRSRLQFIPTRLNFEILRYPADPAKFDKGSQPLALLLEGEFNSNYENRVNPEQLSAMQSIGLQYLPLSKPTKMLVVADGDLARNEYDAAQKATLPLGYSRFDKYKFANKDFLLNSLEYMLDDSGIFEARAKEVKLRLIDKVKAETNAATIQAVNLLVPLLFLFIFGLIYFWRRKKRYA